MPKHVRGGDVGGAVGGALGSAVGGPVGGLSSGRLFFAFFLLLVIALLVVSLVLGLIVALVFGLAGPEVAAIGAGLFKTQTPVYNPARVYSAPPVDAGVARTATLAAAAPPTIVSAGGLGAVGVADGEKLICAASPVRMRFERFLAERCLYVASAGIWCHA